MHVLLKGLTKRFGNVKAVDGIDLAVGEGEFLSILGPSGCGKTTTLRMIAGLVDQDAGKIFIGNNDVSNTPAYRRNTAMVFQNYALFPHMNVYENIAYGLKINNMKNDEILKKVREIISLMNLQGQEEKKVNQLSGGQQQRVALARALIVEPDVLLFDEPLSNLDKMLRIKMRKEIKNIQKKLGITSIYVTHDQEEALSISDRIVIMNNGQIEQIGEPQDIYRRPGTEFVADFIGNSNFFNADVVSKTDDRVILKLFDRGIEIETDAEIQSEKISVIVKSEDIDFNSSEGIMATVYDIEYLGNLVRYTLKTGEGKYVKVDKLNRFNSKVYSIDETVYFEIDRNAIHVVY